MAAHDKTRPALQKSVGGKPLVCCICLSTQAQRTRIKIYFRYTYWMFLGHSIANTIFIRVSEKNDGIDSWLCFNFCLGSTCSFPFQTSFKNLCFIANVFLIMEKGELKLYMKENETKCLPLEPMYYHIICFDSNRLHYSRDLNLFFFIFVKILFFVCREDLKKGSKGNWKENISFSFLKDNLYLDKTYFTGIPLMCVHTYIMLWGTPITPLATSTRANILRTIIVNKLFTYTCVNRYYT